MLTKYHNGCKKLVLLFIDLWCLDFLVKTNKKSINIIKVSVYPILLIFSICCSVWHLMRQMKDYTDLIDLSFTIIFVIAFYQGIVTHLSLNVFNKDSLLDILDFFDRALNNKDTLLKRLREKFYLRNTKLAYIFGRGFVTIVGVCGWIFTLFDLYWSEYHTPMFYYIPGIPVDSIFFYPVNITIQMIIYFPALMLVMWSDVVIMIIIMYCDAELKTITRFIIESDTRQNTMLVLEIYSLHLSLSDKAQKMSEAFWHVYFQKLFTIMLYLCTLLFIFQSVTVSLIVPIIACSLMVTQIFILCYFGQIICNSSEDMADSLYTIQWYELSVSEQKILLMLIRRFQQSIKIETFGFGEISIYTFVQICKASLSYATILYTVFM